MVAGNLLYQLHHAIVARYCHKHPNRGGCSLNLSRNERCSDFSDAFFGCAACRMPLNLGQIALVSGPQVTRIFILIE